MITKRLGAFAALVLLSFGACAAGDGYPLWLVGGSRLMIAASINGHPVRALLDSAAEATLLDREYAKTLGLGGGSKVVGQGSGSTTFEAGLVKGVMLQALGLSLSDQTVGVVDLSDVGHRLLGGRLDCILGREIFDAARLRIDIEARRIWVLSREHEPPGMRLQLVTEHGVETIPVRVEAGEPVRATFDLGNGSDVLIGSKFAERMHWLSDGRSIGAATGGGLGGAAIRQVLTLKSLEIAGQSFTNVAAAIDAQPSASDVNIGVKILRRFLITTDFANHAVWLAPRD